MEKRQESGRTWEACLCRVHGTTRAPLILQLGRLDRDMAGVNRVYFQVVDRTIRTEVGRFALQVLRVGPAPLNADELIFTQFISAPPDFTGPDGGW